MAEESPRSLRVDVLVMPKKGVLDPQGEAVESVLQSPLGFKVKNVRIGQVYELFFSAETDPEEALRLVGEMCTKTAILVNPLIETYEIKIANKEE